MKIDAEKEGLSATPTLSYKVDWLAFTIFCSSKNNDAKIKEILQTLGYDVDLFESTNPRYFYNSGLSLGGFFNIYFNDGKKEISNFSSQSISFQLTGNGCTDLGYRLEELLSSKNDEKNWIWLFKWLRDQKAKITRIDLALDDFSGLCNFDLMIKKLRLGHYRSEKKTFTINRGQDQRQNSRGLTIYVGKMPKGGAGSKGIYYLRMYKKLEEFKERHQLAPKIARESGVWDRYEIAFSKAKAQAVVDEILKEGSVACVYLGVLRNLIEFLNPTKNQAGNLYKNKDKWAVCKWWRDFLKDAEKVKIGSDAVRDVSFSELLAWLRVSVVPSLRLMEQIGLERGFDFYDLIKSCDVDFAKKQKRILKDSRTIPEDLLKLYLKEFEEGYK